MEDLYVKPGNQDRGWNDPPQFSYGLQTARGGTGKRNLLNKRVPPPQLTGSPGLGVVHPPMVPLIPPTNSPLAPPPCSKSTPPRNLCPLMSPSNCGLMATTPPSQSSMRESTNPITNQSEAEPDIDEVVSQLNWALTACRHSVKKQVCEDVAKRVRLFEEMWRSEKLSLPVKRRMNMLVKELRRCNWDAADEIHRSLMVDHVNEISQWMVGIKRLIAETRNLSPDLLQTPKKDSEPSQRPGEPDSSTHETSSSDQNSTTAVEAAAGPL
ncbi:steroid receptor RNA activator 1 [Aplochiton taeniatus]